MSSNVKKLELAGGIPLSLILSTPYSSTLKLKKIVFSLCVADFSDTFDTFLSAFTPDK